MELVTYFLYGAGFLLFGIPLLLMFFTSLSGDSDYFPSFNKIYLQFYRKPANITQRNHILNCIAYVYFVLYPSFVAILIGCALIVTIITGLGHEIHEIIHSLNQ